MKKLYMFILVFIQLKIAYSQCNLNISVIKEDFKCNGGASVSMNLPTPLPGSISAQASGGQAPYEYSLNNSQYNNTGVFTGLYPDIYTLTVKDALNCTKDTIIEITQPPVPQIVSLNTLPNGCECSTLTTATVINGTPPYTLFTGVFPNQQMNDTLFNLCPGNTYTITAIDSLGCMSHHYVYSVQPTANSLALQIEIPTCHNTCDGSIEILNYSSSVSYSINPPAPMVNNSFTGLCQGEYTVTLTANGTFGVCSTSSIVHLAPQYFSNVTTTPALCSTVPCDGTISLDTIACFKYQLYGSSPPIYTTNNNRKTFINLCPGHYTITATDVLNNGMYTYVAYVGNNSNFIQQINNPLCSAYGSIYTFAYPGISYALYKRPNATYPWQLESLSPPFLTIQNGFQYKVVATNAQTNCTAEYLYYPSAPQFNTTFNNTIVNPCHGMCNGSIKPDVSNSNSQFYYLLYKNGILLDSVAQGGVFSNLCAGNYFLKVRSNLGCENGTMIELVYPTLNYTLLNYPGCSTACQGSISLQMQGGKAPFSYTLTGINGTNSIGSVVTNLCEGVYTISATDSIGCSATMSMNLNNFSYFGITKQNTTCQTSCNGSINVGLSGNAPFTYTISPQNGAIQNGFFISNLCAGTYTITATDKDGCTKAIVTTIQPSYYAYLQSEVDFYGDCISHEGQLKTKFIGGIPPYTILSDSAYVLPFDDYFRIPNIPVGMHTIVAKDNNGCIITDTITLPYNHVYIDDATITPESCNPGGDGAITLNAISKGGFSFFSIDSADWIPVMTKLSNLSKGTYKIYVVNTSNCTADTVISIPFNNNLYINIDHIKSVSCHGLNDAMIQLSGDSNEYLLYPGQIPIDSNFRFTNLASNTYTIHAKRPDGCMGNREIHVPEPDALTLELNDIHHTYGDCHGKITPRAYGGTAPYTYSVSPRTWKEQDKPGEINYLCNTTYTITTTDANGCTASQTIFMPYTKVRKEYYKINLSPGTINIRYIRNMDVHLSLYDASGRRIHYQFDGDKNQSTIPVYGVASGLYFLELRFDSDIIIEKLILTQ